MRTSKQTTRILRGSAPPRTFVFAPWWPKPPGLGTNQRPMYFHHRSCCYYSKRGDGCWTSPMPFTGAFGNCPPLPSPSCSPAPSRADQPDTAPLTGFSRLAGKLRPFAYTVLCRGHWFVRAGGWFSFHFFALLFFVLSVCVAFFELFSVVVGL
jgi:hypothetical protein